MVAAAYLDPAWLARQDPTRDFAFLTVKPRWISGRRVQIEQVTGANRLGIRVVRGRRIAIPAYPGGTNNDPVTCTVPVYYDGFYPAFDCNPYVGGTSGAPFLLQTARGMTVVGVIGGLHQGGCTPATSYSPPLGRPALRAYLRAADRAPADTAPAAGSDGC